MSARLERSYAAIVAAACRRKRADSVSSRPNAWTGHRGQRLLHARHQVRFAITPLAGPHMHRPAEAVDEQAEERHHAERQQCQRGFEPPHDHEHRAQRQERLRHR
jgi:hypothetical protein